MNIRISDYLYIVATIGFTALGQLIVKWRMNNYGQLPDEILVKLKFILNVLFDPWIISSLTMAFLASLTWIAAMTKFELSHAYPFTSLTFVIVLLLSGLFLSETITLSKVLGVGLIILGTIVTTRG